MAKELYIGVDNKARKVKKIYIGVNNIAREVKAMYTGVDDKARLCYKSGPLMVGEKVFVSDTLMVGS